MKPQVICYINTGLCFAFIYAVTLCVIFRDANTISVTTAGLRDYRNNFLQQWMSSGSCDQLLNLIVATSGLRQQHQKTQKRLLGFLKFSLSLLHCDVFIFLKNLKQFSIMRLRNQDQHQNC